MSDIAICAKCGENKELCGSVRIDGVQQPRLCRECMINYMTTGDESINDEYWILQMAQLNDVESLEKLGAVEANSQA